MPKAINNFISVSYSGGPEPIEIHHGVGVTHAHPRHWHDEYLICAITGGGGYTEHGGSACFTPPGSLFLLPPGEVHSNYACDEGCSYSNIYLPAHRLERVIAHISRYHAQLAPFVTSHPQVHSDFLDFCKDLESGASQLHRDTSCLRFFRTLLGSLETVQEPHGLREPKAVKTARDFLDENFAEDISLDALSELGGLSPYHFARVFRHHVGMPPHAYQIQLRIARAKSMLRNGVAIADVAHTLGFADQSHFTRQFKRMVGVTPGRFIPDRKNVQYLAFAAD